MCSTQEVVVHHIKQSLICVGGDKDGDKDVKITGGLAAVLFITVSVMIFIMILVIWYKR